MSLAEGLEYAYPGGRDEPCIRRAGSRMMLCGRVLDPGERVHGFVPAQQPEDPTGVHEACVRLLQWQHGVCPVCGGDIALAAGRIGGHGQWTVGRDGTERSDEACPGEGQMPELGGEA